ncbi:MAG: hypothetical protein MJZ64_05925 [Paludibacteraceae bacterium]|nr:hypothetical protein [Paludibacteraceae bacterium]
MKTKLIFLLPMLAVLFAACEKNPNNTSKTNTTEDGGKNTLEKVVTVSATDVTTNSALLTGQLGVEITDYESIGFGMLISIKESDVSSYEGKTLVGDKLVGQTFSIAANGLSAETTYYYRAYLVLNNMQYEYGAVKSFKTEKSSGGGGIGGNHQYVDLGLPSGIKWATCNVGASKSEECGDYFAWGETSPKTTYDWSTYKWCYGNFYTMIKYCTSSSDGTVDNKTVLNLADDAAHVNWGGNWRMPTKAEQDELRKNCTWTWTTQNGIKGYHVKGKNGNSIFLPASGSFKNSSLDNVGSYGGYWSSSLDEDYSYYADCLYIHMLEIVDWSYYNRCYGQSVRPVCP